MVAILNDSFALTGAIGELHAYATTNRESDRLRRGIVFRVVEEWEPHAIRQKLWSYFGPKSAPSQVNKFAVNVGHMHIIDDSGVSHTQSRHGPREAADHDLAVTLAEFKKIPEVVNPRYIVEFSIAKGMPRIVYRKFFDGFSLVVVEELQYKAGLLVKTAYRQK